MTKTATVSDKRAHAPDEIDLTLEDVAKLADGAAELPAETAARLRRLVLCEDPERIARLWRTRVAAHLEDLRRMAGDAGVELLVDALYVDRCLERLRSLPWERPADVLDPRLDVLYQELIAMAGARASRAEGAEKAELERLLERLVAAFGEQIRGEDLFEHLVDRLFQAGPEAAEAALRQLADRVRERRRTASLKR